MRARSDLRLHGTERARQDEVGEGLRKTEGGERGGKHLLAGKYWITSTNFAVLQRLVAIGDNMTNALSAGEGRAFIELVSPDLSAVRWQHVQTLLLRERERKRVSVRENENVRKRDGERRRVRDRSTKVNIVQPRSKNCIVTPQYC